MMLQRIATTVPTAPVAHQSCDGINKTIEEWCCTPGSVGVMRGTNDGMERHDTDSRVTLSMAHAIFSCMCAAVATNATLHRPRLQSKLCMAQGFAMYILKSRL